MSFGESDSRFGERKDSHNGSALTGQLKRETCTLLSPVMTLLPKGNAEIRRWSESIYCFYSIIMVILNQILIILGFPLFIFIEQGEKLQVE